MNVIFRGNGKKKESRKRLHLQRRSSALKPPAVQRETYRYREEERERGGESSCREEEEEEESTVQVRDGRGKKAECNVVSSKRPPASSPLCTHIKLQKEEKEEENRQRWAAV